MSRTLQGPEHPGPDNYVRLEKALFERTATKMNQDTFEFRNKEGLSIAAQLASLREKLESVLARVSRLKAYKEDIIAMQSAILDRANRTELTAKRNSVVHAANVLAGLKAI